MLTCLLVKSCQIVFYMWLFKYKLLSSCIFTKQKISMGYRPNEGFLLSYECPSPPSYRSFISCCCYDDNEFSAARNMMIPVVPSNGCCWNLQQNWSNLTMTNIRYSVLIQRQFETCLRWYVIPGFVFCFSAFSLFFLCSSLFFGELACWLPRWRVRPRYGMEGFVFGFWVFLGLVWGC